MHALVTRTAIDGATAITAQPVCGVSRLIDTENACAMRIWSKLEQQTWAMVCEATKWLGHSPDTCCLANMPFLTHSCVNASVCRACVLVVRFVPEALDVAWLNFLLLLRMVMSLHLRL